MPTTAAPPAQDILDELRPLGSESHKKLMLRYGVREPCYGVKIGDLKKIQKRVKADYQLALDLYDTGVYDAMYLAGLIADERKMTRKDLQRWLDKATSAPLCEYTVAWVAAESEHGWRLGLEWIESKKEDVASAGWNTLCGVVAMKEDSELDLAAVKRLLQRVARTVHEQPNRVRYAMNSFVIAVGSYVKPLTGDAIAAAKKIGKVNVDMGETACKVPDAAAYIAKVKQRKAIGKKRKTVRC
jgi:3-methyladenine DNA glycosylase AlkD